MEHRAFFKAADKCWTRVNGWRLESRQTGTKVRPNCWTVTRNIAAAVLGTRGILSLQLCQGKARLFLQRRCHSTIQELQVEYNCGGAGFPQCYRAVTWCLGVAQPPWTQVWHHPSPAMLRLWGRMGEEMHSQAHLTAHESSWHPYMSNPNSAGSPSPSSEGQGKFSPIAAPTFCL